MPQQEQYVQVRNVRVDVDALRALAHRCDPMKCIGRERGCCATYEVYVDRGEIGTIVGTLPETARHAKGLRQGGEFIDPFEETEGGSCLATHEDGLCVFAYKDRRGATLCSLHTAALEMGLPPAQVKPKACALWPLYLVEGDEPLLTVQPDALDFPCNRRRRKGVNGLHGGVQEIIAAVFGKGFLNELLAVL